MTIEIDPNLISFELLTPKRWRVYYAGVYLYDARSTQAHTQADLEDYRTISAHNVREHIERMSYHAQMQICAAARSTRDM